MTPTKLATVSAFALALAAGPAMAQDSMMGDYDADTSASVSQDEFNTGFSESGTYANLDADQSGTLTEDELGESGGDMAFGDMDTDASGDLNEDEFNQSVFSSYDADASGDLNEEEFGTVDADFGEGGRFSMEDQDS